MLKAESVCQKCGKLNTVTNPIVRKEKLYDERGIELTVLYYICPECKERNVLQVDNAATERLLSECRGILLEAIEKRKNGQTASPKRQRKYDKLSKRLKKERERLKESYKGKILYDADGKEAIKNLTVEEGSGIIENKM